LKNLVRINLKSRVASSAMLCLLGHALFVSVTHHHNSTGLRFAGDTASVSDNPGDSGASPESGSDAHCLSCRLQRNFTSDIHPSSVTIQSQSEPLMRETPHYHATCGGCSTLLFGRAPPLV
jgi:hypothetical protein